MELFGICNQFNNWSYRTNERQLSGNATSSNGSRAARRDMLIDQMRKFLACALPTHKSRSHKSLVRLVTWNTWSDASSSLRERRGELLRDDGAHEIRGRCRARG